MASPRVSVIMLNWNGKELLREFMPSVVGIDYPDFEVIVVDNASTDGSAEFIEQTYPLVKLIRSPRNDGTAEGSNVGAKAARGKYIFFISNDMWLEPAILSKMVPHMEQDERIGICTVKMRRITADGERLMELDSVGGNVDIFGFPDARGIHQQDKGQLDMFTEVFFSFGGAMLIRRSVFDQIGGYDAAFFTLTDDIDLSWRVRLMGYKVVVEPKAVLYHRVSATLDTPAFKRAHRRFLSERNTIRALLKNYSTWSLCWIVPVDLLILLAEAIFFLVLWQWQIALAGQRALAWNLRRFPETLLLRKKVQRTRVMTDREIRQHMIRGIEKFRILKDFLKKRDTPRWRSFFGK